LTIAQTIRSIQIRGLPLEQLSVANQGRILIIVIVSVMKGGYLVSDAVLKSNAQHQSILIPQIREPVPGPLKLVRVGQFLFMVSAHAIAVGINQTVIVMLINAIQQPIHTIQPDKRQGVTRHMNVNQAAHHIMVVVKAVARMVIRLAEHNATPLIAAATHYHHVRPMVSAQIVQAVPPQHINYQTAKIIITRTTIFALHAHQPDIRWHHVRAMQLVAVKFAVPRPDIKSPAVQMVMK